jgi:hypothetical protein
MNILVSATAVQRGAGTDRYKSVRFLTSAERAHVRAGGIVLFRSDYLSGGSYGTYWRMAVDHGRFGFVPRVPTDEMIAIVEGNLKPASYSRPLNRRPALSESVI